LASIGLGTAFVVGATGFIATALVYGGLAAAAYLASSALTPQKPEAPKPEDGKFNLKQSVPPLVYVLGRVKKAGDYVFLEETGGTAWHIVVHASHRIHSYAQHWLHDEPVEVNSGGTVVSPAHFDNKVRILTRRGEALSTAYGEVIEAFPSIWTAVHRGDGLATVMMDVQSVAAEALQAVYPSGMPQHQAIIDGNDRLYDPRTNTHGYTTNLALFRLWHLTHPVGGKLTLDDMYLPDWAHAADVCGQSVTNRSGGVESRYHGGLWFRANNDPVQVGRLMDQAAELVIYERADGKVGVHAGEMVTPDIRLTANDVVSISYDPNRRRSVNVVAVRGRYTAPDKGYNTADAAIYGVPYPTEDERTKTVENQAVQSHNHMARLQKIAYIRANAPRVKIVAHFDPARNVPYRRFVTVHYPPKMSEAIIEITGRPTLSLRNQTYEFEGIVVPASLYAFNAATEEGVPGANVIPVERESVPVPTGFGVSVEFETVAGGDAYFGLAVWDHVNDAFTYELEWQPTAGGPVQSVRSNAGDDEVRSLFLADGVEVRFRLRTWSTGVPSSWTGYLIRTP
jgi:hypothetical protein